jgi:hypothetical protein
MAGIAATSKEYLHIPVDDGAADISAEIAVVAGGEPAEADWLPATWDGDGSYKVLIGPGTALMLTPGVYTAWVRIDAPPEEPVRRSGPILVGP